MKSTKVQTFSAYHSTTNINGRVNVILWGAGSSFMSMRTDLNTPHF